MGILRLVSKKLPANRQWKRSEEKELEKGKEMRSDEGGNEIDLYLLQRFGRDQPYL